MCQEKVSRKKLYLWSLSIFSLISFLIVAFTSKNVFEIQFTYLIAILGKALVIVIAWLLSLRAISKMPVSLYSVINLSRIIFSIIMSSIILGEKITITTLIGMIIVITGLILVNRVSNKNEKKEASLKIVILVLISCLLNSISAIIDKKILVNITSGQLQFWFLLFLTISYWFILLIKKKKINFKTIKKNYWIPITAIRLTVRDRFLFMANEIPESKVSVMAILKQFSAIEAIILGKIVFKEKNIIKKLLCSILIILGIVLTLL